MTNSHTSSPWIHQLVLLLILVGLLLGSAVPSHGYTLVESWSVREVIRKVEPSVVWIVAKIGNDQWSQGTGFVIHEDGYILTSAHVIDGAGEIEIGWPDRFNRSNLLADIVTLDLEKDIGLLHVQASHLPALPLDLENKAGLGDAVIAMGYPAGDELGLEGLTVTRGVLSCVRTSTDGDNEILQTDAAVTLGCSGGPLYDIDTGSVIGIVKGKGMFMLEGFNFAVPVGDFFDLAGTDPGDGVMCAIESIPVQDDPDYSRPVERALEVYSRGMMARGQMDWAEALGHFLAAVQLSDEDPAIAYSTAESYAALGQPGQSLRWLQRAFELGYTDFDGALDSDGFTVFKKDHRFLELIESF